MTINSPCNVKRKEQSGREHNTGFVVHHRAGEHFEQQAGSNSKGTPINPSPLVAQHGNLSEHNTRCLELNVTGGDLLAERTEKPGSEKKYRTLSDALPDAAFMADRETLRIDEINKKYAQTIANLLEKIRVLEKREKHLRKTDIALEILLLQRDRERAETEEALRAKMMNLVMPFFEKLRKNGLTETQKDYLDFIKTNILKECSPNQDNPYAKLSNLTPTEMKVANLIKQGKSTKEIACFLDISSNTVETHREKIRKKLGIQNKKLNLRKTLLSIL